MANMDDSGVVMSAWRVWIEQDGSTFGPVDAPYVPEDPSPHLIVGRAFFELFMVAGERPDMLRPFAARFEPLPG